MNTRGCLPDESVFPNMVANSEYPEFPGIAGTGFFCRFGDYKNTFYITARHCLIRNDGSQNDLIVYLRTHPPTPVYFYKCFTGSVDGDENNMEDIIVFSVCERKNTSVSIEIIRNLSLPLPNQEFNNYALDNLSLQGNQKVRVLGFPFSGVDGAKLSYEDKSVIIHYNYRGFYGILRNDSIIKNRFSINQLNWQENSYNGFSGSPVFLIFPSNNENGYKTILCGILVTASEQRAEFININMVTNLISDAVLKGKIRLA